MGPKKEKHGARKTKICAYLCDNFVAKNKSAKAEPSKLGDVLVRSEVNLKNWIVKKKGT